MSGGAERRLELGLEALLRVGADDLLGDLAVAEEDHRRDREDLVLRGGLLVLVDVELDDAQVLALARDLLEDRADHAAGAAPGRPEVDEDGRLGLDDLRLEARVGDVVESAGHLWCRSFKGREHAGRWPATITIQSVVQRASPALQRRGRAHEMRPEEDLDRR